MDVLRIAKDALETTWKQKRLWLYGFFVAAGGGGGGANFSEGDSIPAWVIALIAVASVLGLAALFMHIISESALISAVAASRAGTPQPLRVGFRIGAALFARMLAVKALALLGALLTIAVIVAPVVLAVLELISLWVGVPITAVLALAAVPWLLTLYFIYEYAMRFVVLEGRTPFDALDRARAFLRGRLETTLQLLIADGIGRALAAAVGGFAVVVIGGVIGGAVYLISGHVLAAVIAGAVAVAPIAIADACVLGTYRSSIWTLGFLAARS
jgi:hypothetical protein